MKFLASRWKQFSALIPTVALSFLDQTILPVALPSIQSEMNAGSTALQWSVNSYSLAIAVFVLICGKIGDRIGFKRSMMLGMLGFIVFSVFCSLSSSVWMLVVSRGFQGLSAAFMFPAQTAMVASVFSAEQRGRVSGLIVSIGSLFLILGPLVGGYLIETASWRWIFWINVPVGALGLWLIWKFLPSAEFLKNKIDLIGFLFFAIATTCLTIFFMEAADWSWASARTGLFAATGFIFVGLLLFRELRASHPFLDLSLFRFPVYSAINVSIFTIQFFMMITVFRTVYIQEVLGYSPLETGSLMFVSSLPLLFTAPIAGYLSDRISPRLPVAIGYLLLIFSCFAFAFNTEPSFLYLNGALLTFGMGIPCIFTPSYSSAIASVPRSKIGAATGMITTLRMSGGTIGLALIHLFVMTVQSSFASLGQRQAVITSFSYVHFALAFLLIVAFAASFILYTRKSAHRLPESPAEGWD